MLVQNPGLASLIHRGLIFQESGGIVPEKFQLNSRNDPWKVSDLISAILELVLSLLLLLGTVVAFITSRFARYLDLNPPCGYIGCFHCHHNDVKKNACHQNSVTYINGYCPSYMPYDVGSPLLLRAGSCSCSSKLVGAALRFQQLKASGGGCRRANENLNFVRGHCDSSFYIEEGDTVSTKSCGGGCHALVFGPPLEGKYRYSGDDCNTVDATSDCSTEVQIADMDDGGASIYDHKTHSERQTDGEEVSLLLNDDVDEPIDFHTLNHDPEHKEVKQTMLLSGNEEDFTNTDHSDPQFNTVNPEALQEPMQDGVDEHFCDTPQDAVSCSSILTGSAFRGQTSTVKVKVKATPIIGFEPGYSKNDDQVLNDDDRAGKEDLEALKEALQAERCALDALEAELENERTAAQIAASEAMAMISRLQEEKSAMQMEVAQMQRMSEGKAEYDQQAMDLLKEILIKREKEKFELEKEVELYRERFLHTGDGFQTPLSLETVGKLDVDGQADKTHLVDHEKGAKMAKTTCVVSQPTNDAGFSTDEDETQHILKHSWMLEEELPLLHLNDESNAKPMDGCRKRVQERNEQEFDGSEEDFSTVWGPFQVSNLSSENDETTCEDEILYTPDHQMPSPSSVSRQQLGHQLPFEHAKTRRFEGKESSEMTVLHSRLPNGLSMALPHREEQRLALEGLQQLSVRLRALEADRELLRQTLETCKEKGTEISLLQEIAQHLREILLAGVRALGPDHLSEEQAPSACVKKAVPARKKRKYYTSFIISPSSSTIQQ